MPSPIDQPYGTTLAAFKGLAIASALVTAGHLGDVSLKIPSLYISADFSSRVAAQQFAQQYRATKRVAPPTIIGTSLLCSGLAYLNFHNARTTAGLQWKLWAGAAASMIAVIPWTIALLEAPTQKLLWVAEVDESATRTRGAASTGIGVKVDDEQQQGGFGLDPPKTAGKGAITPIEEFEPFEDAIVGEEYEQLKVKKLLQKFGFLNTIKTMLPLTTGVLGLWAVLTE